MKNNSFSQSYTASSLMTARPFHLAKQPSSNKPLSTESFGVTDVQPRYALERDIAYYPNSDSANPYRQAQCTLDIHYPIDRPNFATIVWFHGGSLTSGKKEIPNSLMGKGYAIVGVGYRLSPEVTAPAYIEDAAAAVAWVFRHIGAYGGNSNLIFISGHSAGGYLGMMLTLDKTYLAAHSVDSNRIAALIPFSGQAITHFTVRTEQGIKNTQPVIDAYAPLYHVRADAPPIFLLVGDPELELLGRYEENTYFLRMMKLVGHRRTSLCELRGFDHGGMVKPAFAILLDAVTRFIQEPAKFEGAYG